MGKTALVTGAGRGIGRSVAAYLLESGYRTVAVSRTESELHSLSAHGQVLPFAADLTRPEDRLRLADFCRQKGIVPHVLVNNAGAYLPDEVAGGRSLLQANLDVNLLQVRELTALLWESMKAGGQAHVFQVVSVLGKSVRPEAASYTMAKHALAAYNKLLFLEGRQHGIKVTGIYPGSVYTSAWEGSGADPAKMIAPSDIARIVDMCLALSPAAVPEEIHLQCMDVSV